MNFDTQHVHADWTDWVSPCHFPQADWTDCCTLSLSTGYNSEEEYWLVKNSWGPSFGVGGYIKVAYSAERTGIGSPDDT